jgi:hypothetical protein
MVRFLIVEPIYPSPNSRFDSNSRFSVGVTYLRLIIISVVRDVPSTARCSLIDFMNFKIKLTQSFRGVYRGRIYARVFIRISAHTCI